MKQIRIADPKSGLCAAVLPDFGGMLSELSLRGVDVLHTDLSRVGVSGVLAGGMPILFPFCSRTQDDTYRIRGRAYTMPFHGLVKGMPFSVVRSDAQSVTLFTAPGRVARKQNYPFRFALFVQYRVQGGSLFVRARIANRSLRRMPFYIGWHPCFAASSKKDVVFTFGKRSYKSYIDGSSGQWPSPSVDLSQELDHVFWGGEGRQMVLKSPADGYEARILPDEMHSVATICTALPGCVFVEPWTAAPNAIHTGQFLRWVKPLSSVSCGFEIQIKTI